MAIKLLSVALTTLSLLGASNAQNITSDAYQSPPVYPSPQGSGAGDWAAAYTKARALVAQLTAVEKYNMTVGMSGTTICSGNIIPIPRLGFPGLCVSDAGNGLRSTDFVSGYDSGIHVGASWNKSHAATRAYEMAGEFKRKGVQVMLGPVVGPIGRVAEGGRNWEGFSTDPYLCGALVYEHILGTQSAGVQACTKHYIANEQETNRNPSTNAQNQSVASVSSNIDDQTIHELYAWPFQDALRAGSASIMCSYNRINNSYGCQNSKTLNGILKTEMGFQGYVMSDWGAVHGGVAPVLAGLDMTMPSYPFGYANLTAQSTNGSVPQTRIDDQVTRIIAAWYYLGQDTGFLPPGYGMPRSLTAPHTQVIGRQLSSKSVLLSGAQEGHVLVKNVNGALPLKRPNLVSLFGYGGQDNATTNNAPPSWGGQAAQQFIPTLQWVGGGSGYNNPAFVSDPLCAFGDRAYEYGTSLVWDFNNTNPNVNGASDVCFVFINAFATEGRDRPGLHDNYSDSIVLNVASKCNNTIVVIHNAGIRLVDTFYNNPNVTAIVYAHLPGQDAGRALTSLVYGDVSFSGKMPYTVAKNESDYGSLLAPTQPEGIDYLFPQSNFTEGVYIDYKAFDAMNITPRFEFGYGLTYSTFSITNLTASVLPNATLTPYPATAPIVQGGNPNLFSTLFTVSVTLTNTGTVTAAEVAQLYIGIPGGPVRQLRGFEKVLLAPGASAQVTFALTRKDLSMWNVVAQDWLLQAGTYQMYVGNSSRNLPLKATLVISAGATSGGGGAGGGGGGSRMSTVVTKTSSATAVPSGVEHAPWPTASWSCPGNGAAGWGWGQGGSGVTGGWALQAGSGWGKRGW